MTGLTRSRRWRTCSRRRRARAAQGGGLYAGVFNEQTGLFERTGFLGREAFKRDMLSGFTGWQPLQNAGWRTMCLRKFNHPKDAGTPTHIIPPTSSCC